MARRFNGTSDYLEHGAAVVTAVPITMSCWFRPIYAQHASAGRTLMSTGDSAADTKVYLFIGAGEQSLVATTVAVGGAQGAASTLTPIRAGQWHHGCGVFASNTDRRVFLNGRKGTNNVSTVLGTPTVTTIGARYTAGARGAYFDGLLAEAAIWNVALDDADVSLLSRGYYPDQIRRGNLVSYWDLDGQYSPDEIDLKGRFDAVVNGAKPAIADHPPMIPRSRRSRALDFAAMPSGPTFVPGDQPPARIIFQHV